MIETHLIRVILLRASIKEERTAEKDELNLAIFPKASFSLAVLIILLQLLDLLDLLNLLVLNCMPLLLVEAGSLVLNLVRLPLSQNALSESLLPTAWYL